MIPNSDLNTCFIDLAQAIVGELGMLKKDEGQEKDITIKATHYSKEIGFEVVEGIVNKKKYINRASLLSKGNIREMFIVLTLPTEGRFA